MWTQETTLRQDASKMKTFKVIYGNSEQDQGFITDNSTKTNLKGLRSNIIKTHRESKEKWRNLNSQVQVKRLKREVMMRINNPKILIPMVLLYLSKSKGIQRTPSFMLCLQAAASKHAPLSRITCTDLFNAHVLAACTQRSSSNRLRVGPKKMHFGYPILVTTESGHNPCDRQCSL